MLLTGNIMKSTVVLTLNNAVQSTTRSTTMAGKAKHFTVESRDKVAAMIADLPEKPKAPKALAAREIIASLKAEIKAAQAKGYTIEEIVQTFKTGGVDIGLTTLKNALKPPKKKPVLVATSTHKGKEPASAPSRSESLPEGNEVLRSETETTLTAAAKKRGER